jgi:hypothetical protein
MEITTNGQTIWVDKYAIRALLRGDIDTAQKHDLMETFWLIAEAHGMCDETGKIIIEARPGRI